MLSSNPRKYHDEHDQDCIVMAINGRYHKLAFARLGARDGLTLKFPPRFMKTSLAIRINFMRWIAMD